MGWKDKVASKVWGAIRNKQSKKLFKDASGGLQHPVIKSVKPAKNLTARRKTTDEMITAVDKHTKSPNASKIKRDAVIKGSKIHDKFDKIVSKRNKNLKETKTLIKAAGATSVAGAGAAGVSLYNKKK